MEGLGFNANLYKGSKRVAFAIDSGDGGEVIIRWEDRGSKEVEITARSFSGEEYTYGGTPEEKILNELLAKGTMKEEATLGAAGENFESVDIFIDRLVFEYELRKRLLKACKSRICYRLKTNRKGEYYSFKGEYSDQVKSELEHDLGDNLDIIYNEWFITNKGCPIPRQVDIQPEPLYKR